MHPLTFAAVLPRPPDARAWNIDCSGIGWRYLSRQRGLAEFVSSPRVRPGAR